MVNGFDISGTGFFGKGYWGRKTYWFNVPYRWRTLDEENGNYLELLLRSWGDFSESFIDRVATLPEQRDPYLVRTEQSEGVWFYVTGAMDYEDNDKGSVYRLIGERKFSNMPETDEDAPPSDDDDVLAEWYPWFPYKPLEGVGRWWLTKWQDAQYEVINVRARNYDQPAIFSETNSIANEIWLKKPDLTLVFDHLNEKDFTAISTGDGTQKPPFELPILPLRLEYNDTGAAPWLTDNAKFQVRIALDSGTAVLVSAITRADPAQLTTTGAHGLATGDQVYIRNIEGMTEIVDGFYTVTVVDPTNFTLDGVDSSNYNAYTAEGSIHKMSVLYDVPDGVTGETGNLYPEDGGTPGQIDTATSYGTINYLSGEVRIDLAAASMFASYGVPIGAKWIVRGYFFRFFPPPLINYLAEDFGFKNDQNDPEATQRSAIANVTKYLGLKASQDSYRIRGEISLFSVFMRAFYRVCNSDLFSQIPAEHQFVINGSDYTDADPVFIKFDDIRGDEEYYDDDSSSWISLVDKAFMATDSTRWDGLTVGQAYALDVTQGYYGQVSAANANLRGAATVSSVTALTPTAAAAYGLVAGYRYEIQMLRCQGEVYHFSKSRFALSLYEHGVTPPDLEDDLYWIDVEEREWTLTSAGATAAEDVGLVTFVVGVGEGVASPLSVSDDVALRYVPRLDNLNCCFCRSYKMRGEIEAMDEAYDHYTTLESVDDAIMRLKNKILGLMPTHTRVMEWFVTRRFQEVMYGVQNGAGSLDATDLYVAKVLDGSQFLDNYSVALTVEIKGDFDVVGKGIDLKVQEWDGSALVNKWSVSGAFTGFSDDQWRTVSATGSITAYADAGGGQVDVTSVGHGLSDGMTVTISGTTNYNGTFEIVFVSVDNFEIAATWNGDDATGDWATSGADVVLPLGTAGNLVKILAEASATSTDGSVRWTFKPSKKEAGVI